jgi:apolipoprotein D and lipocalin family protein
MREDGGLKVLNKGYSTKDNEWKEIEGKAYFVSDPSEGHLKVSFFGPFYGSYVVFELDKDNYQYAFVAGYNKSYLWLLSRSPTVSDEIIERFIKISSELGFDTNGLIFVDHAQPSQ